MKSMRLLYTAWLRLIFGRNASIQQRNALRMERQRRYKPYMIGRYSYGTPEVLFASSGANLIIGQFCSIANEVKIFLGGEHRTDWITTYPFPAMMTEAVDFKGHPATKGDVVIGNDVWIGSGAVILSGVKVGDGAVVGANCVVARDVPSYAVVSGNPAQLVRMRFSESQINQLLQIAWWNWPIDKILDQLPVLLSGDTDLFIDRHAPNK